MLGRYVGRKLQKRDIRSFDHFLPQVASGSLRITTNQYGTGQWLMSKRTMVSECDIVLKSGDLVDAGSYFFYKLLADERIGLLGDDGTFARGSVINLTWTDMCGDKAQEFQRPAAVDATMLDKAVGLALGRRDRWMRKAKEIEYHVENIVTTEDEQQRAASAKIYQQNGPTNNKVIQTSPRNQ